MNELTEFLNLDLMTLQAAVLAYALTEAINYHVKKTSLPVRIKKLVPLVLPMLVALLFVSNIGLTNAIIAAYLAPWLYQARKNIIK
jgi:hypothetical protein